MKKFRFSLSALLNVRRLKEEIAQKNLLESQLSLQKEMAALEALKKEYQGLQQEIRQVQKIMRYTQPLAQRQEFLNVIKERIKEQLNIVEFAKSNVEMKRREVVRAMQQRKIIENLREKKFSEWETEFYDQERKTFDELATMQFGRKSKLKK